MAIKYLHDKGKKPARYSIRRLLHERIAGSEKGRPLKTIHSSAVTYKDKQFCPREHSLYSITDAQPIDEFLGTALSVTFQHGRQVQANINDEWLVDIMVGDWRCLNCKHTETSCKRPKIKCSCGAYLWRYEEVNVVSEYSGISGGLDALVDIGTGKFIVIEIKTIDKDKFRALLAPMAEHRERTTLYLRLITESKHPLASQIDTSQATILYVSKSFGFKDITIREYPFRDANMTPFKEYKIKADPASVDKLSELGKSVKDFREGKKPIPAKICKTIMDKRADVCCCKKSCFSGKYPDNNYMRGV